MRRFLHERAPLLLIALTFGWGLTALAMGLLAEAHWISILWSSFERLFLLLAVLTAALAVVIIVSRSVPEQSNWMHHFVRHALGPAGLVAVTCWVVTQLVDARVGVLVLVLTVAVLIVLDQRLPAGRLEPLDHEPSPHAS